MQSSDTAWARIRPTRQSRPKSPRSAERFDQSGWGERDPIDVRVAQGRWELSRAFELVYGAYLRQAFYRRCFRVDLLGPQRRHKPVGDNPAIACRIDLHNVGCHICKRYYHDYADHSIPLARLQQRGISPADHSYFCWRLAIAAADQPIDSALIGRRAA